MPNHHIIEYIIGTAIHNHINANEAIWYADFAVSYSFKNIGYQIHFIYSSILLYIYHRLKTVSCDIILFLYAVYISSIIFFIQSDNLTFITLLKN